MRLAPSTERLEVERAELESLLASGVLGRSNNLVRMLRFVCERYFEGKSEDIKEYNIAVQALGRPANFDPPTDTIVRVTAHSLRKRLRHYYAGEGASHPVHIFLPPGRYIPKFLHKDDAEWGASVQEVDELSGEHPLPNAQLGAPLPLEDAAALPDSAPAADAQARKTSGHGMALAALAVAALIAAGWYILHSRTATNGREARAGSLVPGPGAAIRMLAGEGRHPYTDHAGFVWQSDSFCTGGKSFSLPGRLVQGTDDQELFTGGRGGQFHCLFPLPPGTYEVHIFLAESSGVLEATRNVAFSINGGPEHDVDVADDAGGDNIVTEKVAIDAQPQKDGAIHIDFPSADGFLNAIEIVPGIPHHLIPVRFVGGPDPFRDSSGLLWLPDRYFLGGRQFRSTSDLPPSVPNPGLYAWLHVGHFRYVIPVLPTGKYTVRLYFQEHWFGQQNGGIGGVGNRVFDVACNGQILLKHFDIFAESKSSPVSPAVIETFEHIEPTAQGKIEISFTPVVNYPSVAAVEVIPED